MILIHSLEPRNITSYHILILILMDEVEGHITNGKYLDANPVTKTFLIHNRKNMEDWTYKNRFKKGNPSVVI